jgi:hypothetical protein
MKVRGLLLLPLFVTLLLVAADWLTAKPPVWVYGQQFPAT